MPRIRPRRPKPPVEGRYQIANRVIAERALPDPPGAKRAGRRSVTVNLAICPLGWLHNRGHLTTRQFEAGQRLRADYERAGLAPSVTMRWDEAYDRGHRMAQALHRSEANVAAKQRFDAAVAAAGPGLDSVLWRVVCSHESVPEAERALGWPARSGKLVLSLALDRVAHYYRIN